MRILILSLLLLIVLSCRNEPAGQQLIWLDEMTFDEILDPYGPPKRKLNFDQDTMNIGGIQHLRGLGTHAPSRLNINLNRKGLIFEAYIGIDQKVSPELLNTLKNVPGKYSYDNLIDHYDYTKGGTAIFNIFLDGELKYTSGIMSVDSSQKHVEVLLEGAKVITLEALPTADGSFHDMVNWAMAKITFKDDPGDLSIYHYSPHILVNHSGFLPRSNKLCYRQGDTKESFKIMEAGNDKVVFTGKFQYRKGDIGKYSIGDFSEFKLPGEYYIASGDFRSERFRISEHLYDECLQKHLEYIKLQRSGHPSEGWMPGKHLDDGVRQDNGRRMDVSGGWYDANDLRKPAMGNALLLLALANLAETGVADIPLQQLLEEIKWGNKFLFAMQEPDGSLLHYIGYTWEGYRENHWTDNIIGTKDDRTIITRPASISTHLSFIIAECKIARAFRDVDPEYASNCLNNARKAFEWVSGQKLIDDASSPGYSASDAMTHGQAVSAATELFRETQEISYKEYAEKYLWILLGEQINEDQVISGYFFEIGKETNCEGGLTLMGLSDFIRTFPDTHLAEESRDAMRKFAEGYYKVITGTNSFSLIPWILSTDTLSSGKRIGPFWYRNFLHVGVNHHLSLNGAGLVDAAMILNEPQYARLAQCQLDWIYGANPFNASTVTGIGYNQPSLFKTGAGEFTPHTPELTGGVMTGIGSDSNDRIAMFPGWWWTTEYWSPTIAYTIILLNKLRKYSEE